MAKVPYNVDASEQKDVLDNIKLKVLQIPVGSQEVEDGLLKRTIIFEAIDADHIIYPAEVENCMEVQAGAGIGMLRACTGKSYVNAKPATFKVFPGLYNVSFKAKTVLGEYEWKLDRVAVLRRTGVRIRWETPRMGEHPPTSSIS